MGRGSDALTAMISHATATCVTCGTTGEVAEWAGAARESKRLAGWAVLLALNATQEASEVDAAVVSKPMQVELLMDKCATCGRKGFVAPRADLLLLRDEWGVQGAHR